MELLDLSTVVARDTVNIKSKRHPKGKLYELVNMDELGPFEQAQIVTFHEEAFGLMQTQKKLTAAQERRLRQILGAIVSILMPGLDAPVLAELSDNHRSAIVSSWAIRNTPAGAGDKADPRKRPRTGGGSARVSKRSTGATRSAGSTRRSGR